MSTDEQDLECLFDAIAAEHREGVNKVSVSPTVATPENSIAVVSRIGHMTRSLHDALRDLGLNTEIEQAASSIPDARDRLNYVATLTQQAAEKVLNATESAQPIVDGMQREADLLLSQWNNLATTTPDDLRRLVARNQAYLMHSAEQNKVVNGYLTDIMMAQDFQDLTGQVIKKIITITHDMEKQLLALLLEHAPMEIQQHHDGLLNGPVINAEGRSDVVTSQDQVDDLLESLGF